MTGDGHWSPVYLHSGVWLRLTVKGLQPPPFFNYETKGTVGNVFLVCLLFKSRSSINKQAYLFSVPDLLRNNDMIPIEEILNVAYVNVSGRKEIVGNITLSVPLIS